MAFSPCRTVSSRGVRAVMLGGAIEYYVSIHKLLNFDEKLIDIDHNHFYQNAKINTQLMVLMSML